MNSARVFVVCGAVQHGKSTLAKYLARAASVPDGDCSSVIYREVARRMDISEESLRQMPKEDIRKSLIAVGDELCCPDAGYLPKRLYYAEKVRSIAGVRRRTELDSFIEAVGQVDVVPIWIDRPDGPEIKDNTDFGLKDQCRILVENTGSARDLESIAAAICRFEELPKCAVRLSPLPLTVGL